MEGSEDDAGTATNASRRAAAREKDVGMAEDVKATSSFQQEPSETRSSCQTPAMSEDNFDGDSVPSPSAQDVNASTEAILDMIDEFVDGPGAPKRLPQSETDDTPQDDLASGAHLSESKDCVQSGQNVTPRVPPSVASTPEKEPAVSTNVSVQIVSAELPKSNVNNDSVDMSQASSSVTENSETIKEPMKSEHREQVSIQPDLPLPINIPSSSGDQTVQRIVDNECETQERTVKCVTSSDKRDNVTVESAESTSSDSVSDEKAPLVESQTHSPLRRRLVRPALCDRRPDSTVSSTVDSQTVTALSSNQLGRDSIAKDVSSSSDAVPTIHGNVKPEEIRNVSEISICKAETSVSPPKKIKLIRQKVTAGHSSREPVSNQKSVSSENDQCQSTSSDNHTEVSSVASSACSDSDRLRQCTENVEQPAVATASSSKKVVQMSTEESVNSQAIVSSVVQPVESDNNSHSKQNKQCPSDNVSDSQTKPPRGLESESSSSTVQKIVKTDESPSLNEHVHQNYTKEGDNLNETNQDQKKVLPIKLNLATSLPQMTNCTEENITHQVLSIDQSKTLSNPEQTSIKQSDEPHEELENKVPKLTIKLKPDETMSPPTVPKLTIKPLKPPSDSKSNSDTKQDNEISKSNIKSLKTLIDNESSSSFGQSSENKPGVPKLTIKSIRPPTDHHHEQIENRSEVTKSPVPKLTIKPIKPPAEPDTVSSQDSDKSKNTIPKLTIKPIKPPADQDANADTIKHVEETKSSVPKVTIKPLRPPTEHDDVSSNMVNQSEQNASPVPKVTIKPIKPPSEYNASTSDKDKTSMEPKSSIPKLTIRTIHPTDQDDSGNDTTQHIPSVTKINIKPIPNIKPSQVVEGVEAIPSVTKLNIKPILKPPEKINDVHRKSSSSEISESECSENDESASTSDQASASDQGPLDTVPKVTIKLGKPGTESEGKFYTEQNISKTTRKGVQTEVKDDEEPKRTVVISQQEDKNAEKVPKFTIKTLAKSENAPLSPKLTIKPLKPDLSSKETDIPKIKISTDTLSPSLDTRDNAHIPKITIKPVTRSEAESTSRTPKKVPTSCDSSDHIPVVTKLNIKPVLKPAEIETPQSSDDRVPVVSKLNIKPLIKPHENDIDSNADSIPKVTKLNIKPIKNPDDTLTEEKDFDEVKTNIHTCNIPVVTKLNIKPIVKPSEEDLCSKETDNQSSETGNSSDDNGDHIPVVTKINIKPIVRPDDKESSNQPVSTSEDSIPVVTKLNIKPLVKPTENASPSSPKKELKSPDMVNSSIPIVTKLNIKPILNPDEIGPTKSKEELVDKSIKKPSLVMKINMKTVNEISNHEAHTEHNNCNNIDENLSHSDKNLKLSELESKASESDKKSVVNTDIDRLLKSSLSPTDKQNCTLDLTQEKEINERRSVIKKSSMLSSPKRKPKSPDTVLEKKNVQEATDESKSSKNDSLLMIVPSHGVSSKLNKPDDTNKTSVAVTERDVKTTVKPVKSTFQSVQNCTLLKKLLESNNEASNKSLDYSKQVNCVTESATTENDTSTGTKHIVNCQQSKELKYFPLEKIEDVKEKTRSPVPDIPNDNKYSVEINQEIKSHQVVNEILREKLREPLEISISDKISTPSSGQDSPRIILKINKTEQGASSKIITEDTKRPNTPQQNCVESSPQETFNDKLSPKKQMLNSRRKLAADTEVTLGTGKRLRSSRIVDNSEKSSPIVKRNMGKRPSDLSPPQNKEQELSALQSKRLKLGQLLQGNKSLTITPVPIVQTQTSPTKTSIDVKPAVKAVNHSLLNNENCSKNGNSKLHNILSSLHAKQMSLNNTNCSEKVPSVSSDIELTSSMGSSDTVEIIPVENSHLGLQEMLINENSDFRDLSLGTEESSQDPLEVDNLKTTDGANDELNIPKVIEMTPQPKKRGRPRKIPLSEPPRPAAPLPVPALEERPQRSLRLMRDRPAILRKPRGGRGRGRGGRRPEPTSTEISPIIVIETIDDPPEEKSTPAEIDPTSSRIKLPRMTEALDKMPSVCITPLSSRRDSEVSSRRDSVSSKRDEFPSRRDSELSSRRDELPSRRDSELSSRRDSETMFSPEAPELKSILETSPKVEDSSVEAAKGRGSRGGRGGRGRTPRGRGRGRGGGRGAMYMKETLGIYGRVCGPATTTVQLFEEETCMMDDNATPAKPSHLLDEDSQSSVKSSTNESSKMKKSKFADLFDSNKVWTAADVKEYMWPPPEKPDVEHRVMMIQEQVAMFLGVKSFKRRYPELKRRTIAAEERDYVLSKGIVTEALCDLGITAVDASDVLDIMLSDYPHKYEEYRSHQRQRQLSEAVPEPQEEAKPEEKVTRVEMKAEKMVEHKPEVPKVDPEKTRQDMAAAAIASAAEWNARNNAARKGWCVDLQSHTVQRPRARQMPPSLAHVRPPAGFYPHALLPGQYQHSYRVYTPEQLRYFPLNTVLAAPPAPPSPVDSSSDSEAEWGERVSSSDDSDVPTHQSAKRKKLTKVKRSSQADASCSKEEPPEVEVDLCKVCKLRLEANRRYTHERFLVCANCNAKLHPSCVELNADTIRKCREYPWQCAECKTCCACRKPADDDKMLFCDLCDRGFHIYCVGLTTVPSGRWHCVECAICKSCGAREPGGLPPAPATPGGPGAPTPGPPPEWHHQTKRGPGGHKVYSHSLCTPCARAYRIGRYCPLCERSFIGPKGTMQLVICKLCDRQLHQDCVKQTVSALNVLDYTCADCRRGGITSRAAAVRLAPRTIATLFMAKRRFNKYAHRQYLASRLRDAQNSSEAERDRPDDASDGSDAATSDPLDGAGDDTIELNE